MYGSRFTGERRNMLFLHWIGNRLLSLLTNVLYNTTLSDMETCYKLIERELFAQLNLRGNRFDIEPEQNRQDSKRGIRIYEVPISYTGREFAEGKKITWRGRVHGDRHPDQVPVSRLAKSNATWLIMRGQSLIQNSRRGHYDLGIEAHL